MKSVKPTIFFRIKTEQQLKEPIFLKSKQTRRIHEIITLQAVIDGVNSFKRMNKEKDYKLRVNCI